MKYLIWLLDSDKAFQGSGVCFIYKGTRPWPQHISMFMRRILSPRLTSFNLNSKSTVLKWTNWAESARCRSRANTSTVPNTNYKIHIAHTHWQYWRLAHWIDANVQFNDISKIIIPFIFCTYIHCLLDKQRAQNNNKTTIKRKNQKIVEPQNSSIAYNRSDTHSNTDG